jgi:hypothetical protein
MGGVVEPLSFNTANNVNEDPIPLTVMLLTVCRSLAARSVNVMLAEFNLTAPAIRGSPL